VREIDELAALGVDVTPGRLLVSTRAHLITPAHIALDAAAEAARGAGAIGTTLRGIGPAYLDKTARQGVRAGEMASADGFAAVLRPAFERANRALAAQGAALVDAEAAVAACLEAADRLRPYLCDTSMYLNDRLRAGAAVLCEGAQGTFLDVDHGDYPYVTSSSPTAGGALTGLGIGPRHVERVLGVAKCYSTRVGAGPMPTELSGPLADRLRGTGENFWDEFGTTTGRPRRCGWFDAVAVRYAARLNGFTELFLTKLDILSGFDTVQVAIAYDVDGQRLDTPPAALGELARAQPVYETLPGWQEDISAVRDADALPEAVRGYIARIAALCETPVTAVSVGPARDQLIHLA
jgi:adenylosuccinate synthase